MARLDLLSSTSRVETPFIIAEIAGQTFGVYNKYTKQVIDATGSYYGHITTYPNYMQSLNIVKINGSVNTYTLVMKYAIQQGDDPNLLERIFSKAKQDRKIYLSYGDLSLPSFIYKKEECIITDIKSSFDMAASSITYTISCVSQSVATAAGTYNFPVKYAKPSDEIKSLLYDKRYNLTEIFYGMNDKQLVLQKGLIESNDKSVRIEAQTGVTLFDRLKYLVSCMVSIQETGSAIKSDQYSIIINDDVTSEMGGPYFTVSRILTNLSDYNSFDIYEIDIGYQGQNVVTSFRVDDQQTYSILYDYAGSTQQSDYISRIDDNGEIEMIYSPNIVTSDDVAGMTESDKTWWTNVTQYPINATLVIKGLLRPAVLMSYVKLNVLFYGRKHIASGYYTITKQTDTIDSSGYRTTLKLLRVGGDADVN